MAHPAVRSYVNRCVTGNENIWPIDWLKQHFVTEPLDLVLVPGCGGGELERDLLQKGICRQVEAFDVSETQIEAAREEAARLGLAERIHYRVSAFEDMDLPAGKYDGCFFHHSLHHLRNPAAALDAVHRALRPGGLLYLDEYVGPSRRQWDRRRFAAAVMVYDLLPREMRKNEWLEIPGLLAKLEDPSESVASDQILAAVGQRYEILERRDYGGFLLQPMWTQLRIEQAIINWLITVESAFARFHPTWFTVVVAKAG